MTNLIGVFLLTLAIGQLISAQWRIFGLSLAGQSRGWGYAAGAVLLAAGVALRPESAGGLVWTLPAALLSVVILLAGASLINPVPNPERLFAPEHPGHGGCHRVNIPDGQHLGPGLLLHPPESVPPNGKGVCVIPGAGDNKTFFKWRLVQSLLDSGFTVLVIDLPGHGEYRQRPLVLPDGLSAVTAAVAFLHRRPQIESVSVVGISLGGAMALAALASTGAKGVERLVVIGTPLRLDYTRRRFYREVWQTLYGSPVLQLLRETTIRQVWQTWHSGGYVGRHTTSEMFTLLQPLEHAKKLRELPLLLVYSRRDTLASPWHAAEIQAARRFNTDLVPCRTPSHVMLSLLPAVGEAVARWLSGRFPGW